MKLGTKGRYAVMAMTDLAINSGGKPVALAGIAERQKISLSYLEQLFGKLRRSSLVKSVRGPGGGYVLARDDGDICVSEIVKAVDEPMIAIGCFSDKSRCLTHELWEELGNQIHRYLTSVSLADVINKRVLGSSSVLDGPFAQLRAQPQPQPQPQTAPLPVMEPAE
jgi:Rrf2 family iron-sulfur cluster assembly transcriptional regulator